MYSKGNNEFDNRDLKGTSPHNYFQFHSTIQTVCIVYRSREGSNDPNITFIIAQPLMCLTIWWVSFILVRIYQVRLFLFKFKLWNYLYDWEELNPMTDKQAGSFLEIDILLGAEIDLLSYWPVGMSRRSLRTTWILLHLVTMS